MFTQLEPDWRGRRVILIGGGPSLTGFDFAQLEGTGAIIVAINDALRAAPFADVAFSIDTLWLDRRATMLGYFQGEIVAAAPPGYRPPLDRIQLLRRVAASGLSRRADTLLTGGNSGFAALGMALMREAAEVFLLGYDLTQAGHFHGGYEWQSRYGVRHYPQWARAFAVLASEAAARGTAVFNCNRRSAISAFPFATIDESLSCRESISSPV